MFFPDAEEVPNGGIEDGKSWIEGRIEDLIKHRYDAVLDVGGGATGFARLIQEVPLLEAIEGSAVRVVGLFCIGPETADLDYLEQFAEVDMFMPAASVIVLNAGLELLTRQNRIAVELAELDDKRIGGKPPDIAAAVARRVGEIQHGPGRLPCRQALCADCGAAKQQQAERQRHQDREQDTEWPHGPMLLQMFHCVKFLLKIVARKSSPGSLVILYVELKFYAVGRSAQ